MAGTEQNKAIAASYFEAITKGDVAAMDRMLADDLDYWVVGTLNGLSGSHTKPELLGMLEPFSQMWEGPLKFEVVGSIAEGDKVALEVRNRGTRKDGRVYQNAYSVIFELRDGRIVKIREYFDTMHAAAVII
jgi:uncharacterized protein